MELPYTGSRMPMTGISVRREKFDSSGDFRSFRGNRCRIATAMRTISL